jgi:hypothetical protein
VVCSIGIIRVSTPCSIFRFIRTFWRNMLPPYSGLKEVRPSWHCEVIGVKVLFNYVRGLKEMATLQKGRTFCPYW